MDFIMKKKIKGRRNKLWAVCITGIMLFIISACGRIKADENLIPNDDKERKIINLFGPMEKSKPNVSNIARTAFDLTVEMAEEKFDLTVRYRTYTAENYQEKTYDDVCLDRVRNNMDDLYLLNPDTIQILGSEDLLLDLSVLDSAKNLRDVVKTANTVNGKLVAIPQEVVAYGLFINKDMFDKYKLKLPNTPEEFMECCKVFKENGIETPIGANRWWLENFVFAQAYAELYNGGSTKALIEALNKGEARYSDYMRPGFEYLKELIDKGYIDAETASTYEAIEGEGADFLAGKTPVVMAYWGAANSDIAYGKTDFNLKVIGFPSKLGQMPVVSMTGYAIVKDAEHLEDTIAVLDTILSDEALQLYAETNKVISASPNVEVECIDALKPLNDKINENIYVLGSNAGMNVEQWGNTCQIVSRLLNGATVDECMAAFDKLQDEALNRS